MKTKILRLAGVCALAAVAVTARAQTPAPETFQKAAEKPVDLAHDRNLYVVGYAHLDTQWRWSYPQVVREFVANTLRDNFALIEKYPNYVFNFSGSRRYEMMEEYYPKEFAKLKDYVAAGRWFPAGSSVDEGDSVVPSAESLVRHVLYGNRYFRREFGVASEEFMLPDCFGFPYALPTILAHTGVKGFSTQKLTWGSAVGIPFKVGVWEGPDGKSVVAALDPGAYTGLVKEDLSRSESWLKRIENTGAQSGAYVDYHYFGTGDRGGAPNEESVRWVERSIAGKGPVRVIASRSDQMFKDLTPEQIAKLPHYKGELLLTQHSAGSINSAAYMKRWNRKNELLADEAERASVAAAWLGGAAYPGHALYEAWDLLLGSQMHDMLPGTSLPKAYEFCWNDEILAANRFSAVLTHAIGTVGAGLDTQAKGVALVVYNPLSIAREDVVEATVTFTGAAPAAVTVTGPDGRSVSAQVLSREDHRATIAFVASMPSVGFATFDVQPAAAAASTSLRVSSSTLENDRYRVKLAPSGDIASIFDKTLNRELLSGPVRLSFQYEKPMMYPAWNMDWTDRQKPPRAYVEGPATLRVVEQGPARVAIEITRESQGSRFVQTIRLAAGGAGDRVEVVNHIDWQTPESSLKAAFPLTVSNPLATYDTQVGTIQRGNNDPKKYEVPQHQWFDLTAPDKSFGVAILNDCKFGSDKPDDATLRLTLLYTPGTRNRYQDQGSQDFGRHDILYAVTSHAGDWPQAGVPWAGERVNQPLLAFQVPAHAGALGRSLSLFKTSDRNVAIEAVKQAEDGDEIVVRLQELSGQPAHGVHISAAAGVQAAREVDGQERPLGAATTTGDELVVDVPAYSLRAFALKLGRPAAVVSAPQSQPVPLAFTDDVVSTNANRADGRFDAAGLAYPAEQFPARLTVDGINFALGPTQDGSRNALAASGQSITLPAGRFNRVYLLAAADGDTAGQFSVDGKATELRVQNWTGYIGQWDNRSWAGEVPELAYSWFNAYAGLTPGFVKTDEVAWFCSHRHTPQGDDHYRYSYLFKYRLDVAPGAKVLTLPNNPKIRIFAVSIAGDVHDEVVAATPLADALSDHHPDAPRFEKPAGDYADSIQVEIRHPLYWQQGALHYTLDGSKPTATSAVYSGPVTLSHDAVVTAAEISAGGESGPVSSQTYHVKDSTPPRVLAVYADATAPAVRVMFSEPIQTPKAESFALSGGAKVSSVAYQAGDRAVTLTLTSPLTATTQLTVHDVRDASPAGNPLGSQSIAIEPSAPVFHRDATPAAGEEIRQPGLPVAKDQAWTMNVYVRPTQPLDNRTLIAGFGRADNKRDGNGRYFGYFANGVHLWVRGASELESDQALPANQWAMLTASYDGQWLRLYVNGHQVGAMEATLAADESVVRLAPIDPWDKERRFPGDIRAFSLWNRALAPELISVLAGQTPKS